MRIIKKSQLNDEGVFGIKEETVLYKLVTCPKCGHEETISVTQKPGKCPECGTEMK